MKTLLSLILSVFLLFLGVGEAQVCSPHYLQSPLNFIQPTSPSKQSSNDILFFGECDFLTVWLGETSLQWRYQKPCCTEISHCSFSELIPIELDNNNDPILVKSQDVVLVRSPNHKFYALAAYYRRGDGYFYFHIFQLDPNSYPFVFSTYSIQQLEFSPSCDDRNGIRIDANRNGDFVIIWKNNSSLGVKTCGGGFNGAGIPTISTAGIKELRANPVIEPDVAVAESSTQGEANVYFTYVSADRSEIIVSKQDFATEILGISTVINYNNIVKDDIPLYYSNNYSGFYYPRIASPDNTSLDDDFSVIWMGYDYNFSFRDILGITYESNTVNRHNYTDNSEELLSTFGILPNINHDNPCISYTNAYSGLGINVLWQGELIDNISTLSEKTILALSLDNKGAVTECMPTACFKKITDPDNSPEYPSVAGRHSNGRMNACWWEDQTFHKQNYQKDYDWCNDQYRQIMKNSTLDPYPSNLKDIAYPNPSTGEVHLSFNSLKKDVEYKLEVVDLFGRVLKTYSGTAENLELNGGKFLTSLKGGAYFVRISNQGRTVSTIKVIRY